MLSQNIRNIIAGAIEQDRDLTDVASLFIHAANECENEQDRETLKVIGGSLSMGYNADEKKYLPHITWSDGRRSFAIEDIDEKAIEVLKDSIPLLPCGWMRAQLSGIMWSVEHSYQYGKTAVLDYIRQFQKRFDAVNWLICFEMIQCAFNIARELGGKSNEFVKVVEAIDSAICKLDGQDPLFLSLSLIELVFPFCDTKIVEAYLQIVEKIFERNRTKSDRNDFIIERAFNIQQKLLKYLKKDSSMRCEQIKMARFYESLASEIDRNDYRNAHMAIHYLEKAIQLYDRKHDQGEILRLRKQIEVFQQAAYGNMQPISFQYDASEICKWIDELFEGLSTQEMIVQIAFLTQIHQVSEIKAKVAERQSQFVFTGMLPRALVDCNNRVVEKLDPLDWNDPEKDQALLFKHMVAFVNEDFALGEAFSLNYAWNILRREKNISEENLDFLTYNNPIIPENRADIIRMGIYMGLNGNLYAALHLLLPQVENIFRHLVCMCGDTVTYLKEDGTEEYKPLSQLFRSKLLQECYDKNMIFAFQSIMDEKAGSNLRNLIAHGLIEPDYGNSGIALCFLFRLVRLLCMYSTSAWDILKKLRLKEENKTQEMLKSEG